MSRHSHISLHNVITKVVVVIRNHPASSKEDRHVLEKVGIEILKDPDGFLSVNKSSIVFSHVAAVPVKQVITDIARLDIIL
jgi:hypothetical protein